MARGFVILVSVLDIYSRNRLCSSISNALNVNVCVDTYTEVVCFYRSPESKNTAPGSQLPSGAKLSTDRKSAWTDNFLIERFWHALKVEVVYLPATDSVAEAKLCIGTTIDKVNAIRPHSAADGKTAKDCQASTLAEILLMSSCVDPPTHLSFSKTGH